MKFTEIIAIVAMGPTFAEAFFRMPCHSRLVLDQVDPIVNPGQVPATHVHSVMGGNNFHPNCTGNSLKESSCTTCMVRGDGSAYWVPALYFQDEKTGMFELVEQVADMLVYYLPVRGKDSVPDKKVHLFPPEFRMLAGDPKIRSFPGKVSPDEENRRQRAIGFNCMDFSKPAKGFLENNVMPDREGMKQCKDGLRAEIAFPNCWDGKNADSEDHRSHVAYPFDVQGGACPPTHPKRIISILFETTWNVAAFGDRPGRFVWSHADPTGFGYHGDFLPGWEDGLLERVVASEACTRETMDGGQIDACDVFVNENRLLSNEKMKECKIAPLAGDDFEGPMPSLPGCSVITEGPDYAPGCDNHRSQNKPAPAPKKEEVQIQKAPEPEPYVAPEPEPAPAAPSSKCSNQINKDDPNVVWVTETVTHTDYKYAKRTAMPKPQHRHAHRKRHGRL